CIRLCIPSPPTATLFPYTTLFRSVRQQAAAPAGSAWGAQPGQQPYGQTAAHYGYGSSQGQPYGQAHSQSSGSGQLFSEPTGSGRSEEHTSELQSRENLVCRLLLEK